MTDRRRDTWLAAVISGVIVLSTLAPYLLHWARPISGRVYTGIEYNTNDQASYLMWMNQVRLGANSVTNLYVHDLPDRFAPNPLWWLLGLIGRVLPVSTVAIYHAARVLLSFAYLMVLFALVGRFAEDRLTQWVAWLLCALGGGMGWLYAAITHNANSGMWVSADYMPEMWSYSSMLYFPHFVAGLLLMVGCMHCLSRAWEVSGGALGCGRGLVAAPTCLAGMLLGVLALVHTYTVVTVVCVAVAQVVCWRAVAGRWRPALGANLGALVVAAPFFGFQFWEVSRHEALRLWAEANVMHSPAPWSYVLGAGLVGAAALFGGARVLAKLQKERCRDATSESRARDELRCLHMCFVLSWILGTVVLLYSTLSFERRCVEGLHIALCMLAAPVVVAGARRLGRNEPRVMRAYAGAFVAVCALTSVWYLARELPSTKGYAAPAAFILEQAAYTRLGAEGQVFAQPNLGQWIAAQGRVRVYAGHMQLTYDIAGRTQYVKRFFSPAVMAGERRELFLKTGCNVIAAAGGDAALLRTESGVWREVFRQGDAALFTEGP